MMTPPRRGTLTFQPGQTLATLSVPILDDNLAGEPSPEDFSVVLSNPSGATLGSNSTAAVNISEDNEGGAPLPPVVPLLLSDPLSDLASTPPTAAGDSGPGLSAAGVRYSDGVVQLTQTDLVSSGFGMPWGQTRSWSNGPGYTTGSTLGNGWVSSQLAHLLQGDGSTNNTVVEVANGSSARYFDLIGSTYQTRLFDPSQLTYNSTAGEFVLTDATGAQIRFYDFSGSLPAAQRGQFKSYTDQEGNVTSVVSHTSDGKVTEVQRSNTTTGTTVTDSYLYTYLPSTDPNPGLLSNVTLRRQVNGGAWSTVRQVQYAYYNGTEAYGNLGDLKTVTIEDASGNVLDTNYYRYYVAGEANGYAHGLKYVFNPASYRRLTAALGTNLSGLSDAQVAPYADQYFQYDAQQRVTQETAAGAGSSSSGGLGTFTYAYTSSGNTPGYNRWAVKSVETLPDGNQNIVYTNAFGEVMLAVYHDVSSNHNWETFRQYDNSGHVILEAAPSAVTGYDDTKADLLNNQNGNYQYLSDSTGLIRTFDFYSSTTAGETTAGGVAGYLQDTKIRQGELGSPITLESWQYFAHAAAGVIVAPVATDTVYRNTDGTGAETTSYAYTWYSGTGQEQSVTVTHPVISSAQNGPGTPDVDTIYLDVYGRPTWSKDADGYINYLAYDQATGAVVKSIQDVDTTRTGDFTGLPSGWSTPSGGGLHLVTQHSVDALGRDTKDTDPNGNVTYTVYNDPNHEVRIYRGWNSSTGLPTGPTLDYREDLSGTYAETLTMSATPHLTNGVPDGTEAVSGVQTLSRDYVNNVGQVVSSDAYFNLSGVIYSTAANLGTEGTNYYRTRTGYDNRGRPNRVQHPTGTIERAVYDGLGRVVSTWVGTNDTPTSGDWSPTNNTGSSNMVQLSALVYDNGGVGDSNLTKETDYPGNGAAARESDYFYDWRDRRVASKAGVQASEDTSTHRPITYTTYDNLNEATLVQQFDGDTVTISSSNDVPQAPSANLLRAETAYAYDDQGRVYQQQVYDVNPSTGAVSSTPLMTNNWYDHRGDLIKTTEPGGLVTKDQYDGAGRQVKEYSSDGGGDLTWTDATNVTGDNVLSQQEWQYDANGNVIETLDRERNHDETTTGALGDPNTSPKARVYYTGMYYDAADRLTASVDVGTNGGTAWVRPASAPAPSDTVLVTSYAYNAAGWLDTTTDPRGIATKDFYDNLGRVTKEVQAYTNGTPTSNSDKTTEYTYDGDNNLLTVQADLPGGSIQQTRYVYGVSTGAGSAINSNDVLSAVQHPDPSTGQASASQQDSCTVNALGQVLSSTDRNGNVHSYSYDVLGRLTVDAITTLGAGVDGSVRRIETAYDTQGNPYLITSFDAPSGGNVVNQVQRGYNGLRQLTAEYQSHSGAVVVGSTPVVQYAYSEMAGGANHSRLVTMTYPDGRVLTYNYAAGLDNSISRLTSLSDSSGTLESYSYLGLDTVVKRAHPQPGVDLSYIKQSGEANGDAGDQYTGLDRFGRVVDQRWLHTADGSATDRFQYGYDRDSNVLYKNNLVNAVFSELYHASGAGNGYDLLNQMTAFSRGTLSASQQGGVLDMVASPNHSQSWNLDAMGNFSGVTTDGSTQTRTHNQQNEITSISGQGAVTYDSNGNLTADGSGKTFVYDGWNRLVQVKSGSTTLASYQYDGLGRRVVENRGGVATDLYYSSSWQVLEERQGGAAKVQYVWAPVTSDTLVERDRDATGSGKLSERLYAQQDANGDVTALVNTSGQVVERYDYDPYGQATVLSPTWAVLGSSAYAWVYLHQGGRYDSSTGLYNFRNRDYSPSLGRWLQQDPLGLGPDSNSYRYVGDQPVGATDPSGLAQNMDIIQQAYSKSMALTYGKYANEWNGKDGIQFSADPVEAQIQIDQAFAGGLIHPDGPYVTQQEADTFGHVLDATDSFFAGWAYALSGGTSNGARELLWGETATKNHHGKVFYAGKMVGGVHGALMTAAGGQALYNAIGEVGIGSVGGGGAAALEFAPAVDWAMAGEGVAAMGFGGIAVRASMSQPPDDSSGASSSGSSGQAPSSQPLRPEKIYTGSKKHGINWTEGPATAKSTGKPQGQWSAQDLEWAGQQAATLPPGEGKSFPLPPGSTSVVHLPDGTTVPATHIWVRNNGTGTFHGYPHLGDR